MVSVLLFLFASFKNHWVGRFDVVVDNLSRQDSSLALRQVKKRQLVCLLVTVRLVANRIRVVNIEHTSSKS